jgi:hypothetical protein
LDLCRGEYIARTDQDDISLPERFEKQVAFLDSHPDVGVLGTSVEMFGTKNFIYLRPQNVYFMDFIRKYNQLVSSSVMMRKSLLDQYGLRYDPDYDTTEDYDLWVRMLMVSRVCNLPDVLVKYRWHLTNGTITQKDKSVKNSMRVNQNMLDFLTPDKDYQNYIKSYDPHKSKWLNIPIIKIRRKPKKGKIFYRLFGFIPLWIKRI